MTTNQDILSILKSGLEERAKEKEQEKQLRTQEKNTSLAAKGAIAHRLQCRTACKIQNGRQGAPKWLGFWAFQATFAK